jgi:hypothetical protein
MITQEEVVANFTVLSWYLDDETEENDETFDTSCLQNGI